MNLFRSLIIACLAVAIARPVCSVLGRRFAWILLLAPYLTPTLLVGYAYANFSLSLVRHPEWNETFYSMLLWLKLTPVAVLVLYFSPQPVSSGAIHCQRLLGTHWLDRIIFRLKAGTARAPVAAGALVFLLAYGEFELASLMYVKSWTVALFDAHVGGLALGESLQRMILPLLIETTALLIAVAGLLGHRVAPARQPVRGGMTGWIYLSVAFVFVLAIPAGIMLRGTLQGSFENFALGREITASLLLAAGTAFVVSLLVMACRGKTGGVLAAIGLLGPLVLSLIVLAALQMPGLRELRTTPIPLILTMAVALLPVAFVLKLVLDSSRPGTALHVAGMMDRSRTAREIVWHLKISGRFWTLFLLFVWAYWDLTASAILAPITMTPVTVRLYNLMHYGRTSALSTMLFAAFVAPLVIGFAAVGTRRWWARG